MEVKNICDDVARQEILARIQQLTPQSQRLWGKMDVAQMLAHVQVPMGVGLGEHQIPRSFMGKLFGGMIKKILSNEKPFKRSLPTDRSFLMMDPKDFYTERTKVIDMINRFKEENIVTTPHPFFGKLTKEEWGKGTWKHLDHHLQQFGV